MADTILVVRAPSGLSGDMFLAGLARLCDNPQAEIDRLSACLPLEPLRQAAKLTRKTVGGIAGWGLELDLPHQHEHRHLADVAAIIDQSGLTDRVKALAHRTFELLAQAEATVHATSPERVHFHEVGALDSILDVCLVCALYDSLSPDRFVCGSLPVCDGHVRCAHGTLSTPAPAVLALLEGLPIHGIDSKGETLTPTAVSLLKVLEPEFGPWPAMVLKRQERVYGTRVLPDVPNGAIFAWGTDAPA
ncbi:hypothetical protein JCM15519_00980 [Fundidesulfovibrio butyratiphilus]